MNSGPRLNAAVVAARQKLNRGRDKLLQQHASGTPGVQLCTHFTEVLEEIVRDLFDDAWSDLDAPLRERLQPRVAVVAHSGFGRREMAPYSDLDIMLLHAPEVQAQVVALTRRFSQNLYDTGMDVGFSARSTPEACRLAIEDGTVLTSVCRLR
jgi:[protein-PII] uridylyltransferase